MESASRRKGARSLLAAFEPPEASPLAAAFAPRPATTFAPLERAPSSPETAILLINDAPTDPRGSTDPRDPRTPLRSREERSGSLSDGDLASRARAPLSPNVFSLSSAFTPVKPVETTALAREPSLRRGPPHMWCAYGGSDF